MNRHGAGTAAQWALLCALAFGVIAMHHVGTAPPNHAAAGHAQAAMSMAEVPADQQAAHPAHDPASPTGHHSLLHLCMAVLCGVVALALGLGLIWTQRHSTAGLSRRTGGRAAARAPPGRPGRDILLAVCVLRE